MDKSKMGALVIFMMTSASLWAGDLEGSLTVRGGIVRVDVVNEDQTPAVGIKVRMVNEKQEVVAEGKINADGEWTQAAPGPGSYEVVVEDAAGKKAMAMPFNVKYIETEPYVPPVCPQCPSRAPEEPTRPWPWLLGVLGLVAAGCAAFGIQRTRRGRVSGE